MCLTLFPWQKARFEMAIRTATAQAVKEIVSKITDAYFRYDF